MRRGAIAATLALSLTTGGSGAPSEHVPMPAVEVAPSTANTADPTADTSILELWQQATTLAPGKAEQVRAAFDRNRAYWTSRGETRVAATNLVILSGADTFTCKFGDETRIMTPYMQSHYCPGEPHGTVVVTANGVNSNTLGPVGYELLSAHELGHAETDATGQFAERITDQTQVRDIENEATCYAGATMETYATPAELYAVSEYLGHLATDRDHGDGQTQARMFAQGVAGGEC